VCDVECGLAQPQKPMEERAVEEEEEKDKDTPASVTGRNCFFLSEKKKKKTREIKKKAKTEVPARHGVDWRVWGDIE